MSIAGKCGEQLSQRAILSFDDFLDIREQFLDNFAWGSFDVHNTTFVRSWRDTGSETPAATDRFTIQPTGKHNFGQLVYPRESRAGVLKAVCPMRNLRAIQAPASDLTRGNRATERRRTETRKGNPNGRKKAQKA
jgi:hypothetical protein